MCMCAVSAYITAGALSGVSTFSNLGHCYTCTDTVRALRRMGDVGGTKRRWNPVDLPLFGEEVL